VVTKLKSLFASIGIKLFLLFWLITISSILITRLVSSQLEQQSIIIPNHHGDLKKLQQIAKRISKKKNVSINSILNSSPKRMGASLLIKNKETQEVFHSRKRFSQSISDFLAKNNFSNKTTIQFPYARVTGPELINIDKAPYQLYIAVKSKHPHFGSVFMQLPYWFRFIIPLIISISLCWLLARTLTRPILSIKNAATEIGKGNYQARVDLDDSRGDEIGAMSKSFNQMAEKLSTNMQANQRLLADVSHELRSPMTRLQIALGLIEKSAQQGKDLSKHLARCEREIGQLDSMISNVLTLSRMENTFQKANFSEQEVSLLLATVIDDAQYLADEKSISINNDILVDCRITIDQTLMQSALNNILINAIKHSEQNSEISISSALSNETLSISISDSAIGVPEEQLSLLFTPFYRVSTARDRETGGTGLGLAIAKQAIDIHKGKIAAKNNHSGGLTITIELPFNR
jgi:two-component system sensor histidine kinase CpxA